MDVLNTLTKPVEYLGGERLEMLAHSPYGGAPQLDVSSPLANSSVSSLACGYLFKALTDMG